MRFSLLKDRRGGIQIAPMKIRQQGTRNIHACNPDPNTENDLRDRSDATWVAAQC
jgi:hypothetical protein